VRIAGAALAAIAAVAWIAERSWGKANSITILIQHIAPNAYWAIILLAISAFVVFAWQRNKNKKVL
jgi:hypothetical protein